MKQFLPSLILLGASMMVATPLVSAQTAAASKESTKPAAKKPAAKKPAAKKSAAKKPKADAAKEAAGTDEDDKEPDLAGTVSVDYKCELGNNLTIFENAADDKHVALRWNKRLIRMTRVDTTTGANRFENRRKGLIWIGIPAKGILLDSKKGQQLANECKNAEQLKEKAATAEGSGILSAPVAPATPPDSTTPMAPAAPATAPAEEKPQT
jgi:membrane-bound inhibitor of C-type lysozyme